MWRSGLIFKIAPPRLEDAWEEGRSGEDREKGVALETGRSEAGRSLVPPSHHVATRGATREQAEPGFAGRLEK